MTARRQMTARVTLMGGQDQAVEQEITVPPFDTLAVDAAAVTAPYVSAMVEIDGGGGVVEQRAQRPAGESIGVSVAPCTTQTSAAWYLAEGFTAGGAVEQLILTNPYNEVAIVDIGFATAAGSRQPAQLQGTPVQPHSVEVIDLATIAARDEAEVAVKVAATFGELVVGRAQVYQAEGRLGYGVGLAAPALRSQWWFANGDKGAGVTERYSLYNPTDDDVEVQPTYLGIPQGTDLIDPIVVPARQVVTYTPTTSPASRRSPCRRVRHHRRVAVDRRRTGRHPHDRGGADDVGRARCACPAPRTAMSPTRGHGDRARRADEDALVVYNIEAADAVVTVQAVSRPGARRCRRWTSCRSPPVGLIAIPLIEPACSTTS